MLFAVFLLATLFLIANTAFAADEVKISLSTNDVTTYIGDSVTVDITILNNQLKSDTFSMSVFPSYWYGIRVDLQNNFVNIGARSNATTKIYFDTRSSEAIISPFTITVESINNKNFKDSGTFKLTVLRKSPVYVSDIKSNKYLVNPGEIISIDSYIKNTALASLGPFSIQTNVKYGDMLLKRFDDFIDIMPQGSIKKISNTYNFEKYASPGKYYIETIIKDDNNIVQSYKISDPITMNEISKLTKEKSISYGLISQTITIKVRNDGNTLASNFYITESVPQFAKNLFYPQIEPDKEEKKDIRVVYYWFVDRLMPGQEKAITYEIRSASIMIALIVLIVFVAIAFKFVFSPKIVKRVSHFGSLTRDKEIVVSIEARNNSRHEIKDVYVRDFVPSIVSLVERFGTIKPTIKRLEGGTELIWKIDSLKPFEERVLTYSVKPVVEIAGSLRLPKTRIIYLDKKKKRKVIASKSIWIRAK